MGNGKNHKSIIGIAELSIAHFKCDHVECLAVPLSLGSFIPQVHRLCFLQIWGKWARGRRSIQARQSEWPMTVQNRRKLEKCVSTLQSGRTEGSNRAQSAPEVDTGEQRARSQ